jgi:hypothetical protein
MSGEITCCQNCFSFNTGRAQSQSLPNRETYLRRIYIHSRWNLYDDQRCAGVNNGHFLARYSLDGGDWTIGCGGFINPGCYVGGVWSQRSIFFDRGRDDCFVN